MAQTFAPKKIISTIRKRKYITPAQQEELERLIAETDNFNHYTESQKNALIYINRKSQRINRYHSSKPTKRKPRTMKQGGKINESTAMVLSQNKEIAHHTEELKNALKKNPEVEPWVIGKIERASTDISDVTHYLDGRTEYAEGGEMESKYMVVETDKTGRKRIMGRYNDYGSAEVYAMMKNDFVLKGRSVSIEDNEGKLVKQFEKGGAIEMKPLLGKDGERRIDAKAIDRLEMLARELPQTKYANIDKNGRYIPKRKQLHKKIVDTFKKNKPCIVNRQPIAILTGGAPASGKSTFIKKYVDLDPNKVYHIDADEVRAMLPEYEGWNASQTHLETSDIVTKLIDTIGQPCEFDLIYDGTMNRADKYTDLVDKLHNLGYKVFIIYISIPKEVSIERSRERYKSMGRYVPKEVIDKVYSTGLTAFEDVAKNMADGYVRIDGISGEIVEKGGMEMPKNIEYGKGGKIGFEALSNKVAKNYEGKSVKPEYRKLYGKTYSKEEAKEVGDKVASKVYRLQLAKMEMGGEVGDNALVLSANKMGYIVEVGDDIYTLRFPDGTQSIFRPSELQIMNDDEYFTDGGYMADGGKIKGDTLENVRKDAKSLSRNSKEDMYLVEEKHYEFSNTNDKKIVTQYTVATQEDVDYIKEMPKNRLVVSFKILGKYSNGELKSSEQEVLFAKGGYMADGDEVHFNENMERMRNSYDLVEMKVKGKIASSVGIDQAIELMSRDYSIDPIRMIVRAVSSGLLSLDEINKDLVNNAEYVAESVTNIYKDSGEGIGSSDMTYFTKEMLDGAGYKTDFINNRLTRVDEYFADGGMMADGGAIKGSNPSTGEKFGVVIGSLQKEDGLTTLTIRSSYSTRINSYELRFDEKGFLSAIGDFGYSMDGTYPDMNQGSLSVRNVNADNKKETIDAIANITSPSFAKKVYDYVQGEKMAKGGDINQEYVVYVNNDQNIVGTYNSKRSAKMAMDKLWETNQYESVGMGLKSEAYSNEYFAEGGEMGSGVLKRFRHKHIPTLTYDVIDYTSNGYKGIQKDSKSLSAKERKEGKIAYYSKSEIKELFDEEMAKGGDTSKYNYGRSWHMDRRRFNKSEDYELTLDTRKKALGGSINEKYEDWEMVVLTKDANGKSHNYRFLVSARNIGEAKEIATDLWNKKFSDMDETFYKVMSDSKYRMDYGMADGGELKDDEGNSINLRVGDKVVEYKRPSSDKPKKEYGGQGEIISINGAMAKVYFDSTNYEKFYPLKDLKKMAHGGEVKGGKYNIIDEGNVVETNVSQSKVIDYANTIAFYDLMDESETGDVKEIDNFQDALNYLGMVDIEVVEVASEGAELAKKNLYTIENFGTLKEDVEFVLEMNDIQFNTKGESIVAVTTPDRIKLVVSDIEDMDDANAKNIVVRTANKVLHGEYVQPTKRPSMSAMSEKTADRILKKLGVVGDAPMNESQKAKKDAQNGLILFTPEIDKKLFEQYKYGSDMSKQDVVAKIFNPFGAGTWYVMNADPEEPDYLWGIVDLFEVEMGSMSREELVSLRIPPLNVRLERDVSFKPINAKELWTNLQDGKKYKFGGNVDYKQGDFDATIK
jgi:predicted ABC-type ATPase